MTKPTFIGKSRRLLKKLPKRYWIIGGVFFVILTYALIFFIPKQVAFSYASSTCVRQLVIAPDLHKQVGNDTYKLSIEGGFSLFGARIVGLSVCAIPQKSIQQGEVTTGLSLFGGPIALKQFAITTPAAPAASIAERNGAMISTIRPLTIELTEPDVINRYYLVSNLSDQKQAPCGVTAGSITCDIKTLALDHGAEYSLTLKRALKDVTDDEVENVGSATVKTMVAAEMTGGSVNEGMVIYDTPTELRLEFNHELKGANITLVKEDGDKKDPVTTAVDADKNVITLKLNDQLARKAMFALTINDVDGADGSSLAEPITLRFTTSGGPKVANVSAASTSVGQNEQIVITFDQPIKAEVDVAKFVRLEGVNGGVRKLNDTQVAVTLKSAALCGAFSVIVAKDLPSGSNGAVSDKQWKFDSRVICGYSRVIGQSVNGRAINAYYFGTGGTKILFTAGIHGSEPSSQATMQAFVNYLQSNGYRIPGDKQVVVVPNTNPDGIAAGSRNNANNVNLGRNFPTANWSASIETASGVLPQGGGTSPGSEPEAAALITLTRQLRPRVEVSFHAQGSLVGANKFGDSTSIGDMYAQTVRYGTMYYNAEEVMGYAMTGEYEDWMGEEMVIPAILIELPRASGNYLESQKAALMKVIAL